MSFSESIFRANDIRGAFGKDFDLPFAETLAAALAGFLYKKTGQRRPQAILCHDARLSSPPLFLRLRSALLQEGLDVASIGLAPSPLASFALSYYGLDCAVIVTASHNPPSDNGFKIILHESLSGENIIQSLKEAALRQKEKAPFAPRCAAKNGAARSRPLQGRAAAFSPPAAPQGMRRTGQSLQIDPETAYIQSLKKEFAAVCGITRHTPFVVDGGNGAAGPLAKKVFSALGLEPQFILCEPDGSFPHHPPDPTVEAHLSLLKSHVAQSGSLFGIGFDGDGDRIGLVTAGGRFVFSDELGFLILKSIQKSAAAAGQKALFDVKCSERLFQEARALGFSPIMIKSGHRFARESLKEHGALFALELSGHIFFNDRPLRGFDDAIYSALRLVEILSQSPSSLEELLPPPAPFRTAELRLRTDIAPRRLLSRLRRVLERDGAACSDLDGLRFWKKDSFWGLLRESQTQSGIVSLRFEARRRKDFLRLRQTFEGLLGRPLFPEAPGTAR